MKKNYLKEIAEILEIRFPIAELSKKLGYSKSVVSSYYNNKKVVSNSFIEKLNEVYNIDYKKFVKKYIEPNYYTTNKETFLLSESETKYIPETTIEKDIVLKHLFNLKKDTEKKLTELEKKELSAKTLNERLEVIKILKIINNDINDIKEK